MFALFAAASSLLLWEAIKGLFVYAMAHESCSHVVLIPFISLALVYVERKKIFLAAQSSPVAGWTALVSGVVLYWTAGRNDSIQDGNGYVVAAAFSIVLVWVGSFLLCYGNQAARAAVFPLLFLLLMIPLPDSVLNRTIYLLQQGSTEIAYLLFKFLKVPVFREGFLLYLPKVTIEVATECSGIRSSMALLITCLLAAHLFLRTYWKMAFFVALVFPLAILKNGIRIATLALLSIYVNPRFLYGSLHRDGGIVFFMLDLAILGPVLLLLQRAEVRNGSNGIIHRKAGPEFAGG